MHPACLYMSCLFFSSLALFLLRFLIMKCSSAGSWGWCEVSELTLGLFFTVSHSSPFFSSSSPTPSPPLSLSLLLLFFLLFLCHHPTPTPSSSSSSSSTPLPKINKSVAPKGSKHISHTSQKFNTELFWQWEQEVFSSWTHRTCLFQLGFLPHRQMICFLDGSATQETVLLPLETWQTAHYQKWLGKRCEMREQESEGERRVGRGEEKERWNYVLIEHITFSLITSVSHWEISMCLFIYLAACGAVKSCFILGSCVL